MNSWSARLIACLVIPCLFLDQAFARAPRVSASDFPIKILFVEQAVAQPMTMASHSDEGQKVAEEVRQTAGYLLWSGSRILLTAKSTYFWGKWMLIVARKSPEFLGLQRHLPASISSIVDPGFDDRYGLSSADKLWVEKKFALHWPGEQWGLRSEKAARQFADREHDLPVINTFPKAMVVLDILKLKVDDVLNEIPINNRNVGALFALVAQKLHQYRIEKAAKIGQVSEEAWEAGLRKWVLAPLTVIGLFYLTLVAAQGAIYFFSYSPQKTNLFASLPLWVPIGGLGVLSLSFLMAYRHQFRATQIAWHEAYQTFVPLAPLTGTGAPFRFAFLQSA